MRRVQGYATFSGPESLTEYDTIQCGHCQRVIFTKPGTISTIYLIYGSDERWREEPGAFCRVCMRPVCLSCHDVGTCRPWERMIEAQEAAGRRTASSS